MSATDTDTKAKAARARQFLHSAAEASKQLEENVRELVAMRAWDVLGYENFSEMWEKENGFKCPSIAVTLAVRTILDLYPVQEGRGRPSPGRVTAAEVAEWVGLPTVLHPRSGARQSSAASDIIQQIRAGIPLEMVKRNKRSRTRRTGKTPEEFVLESVYIVRFQVDEVAEIARQADVPKAEIYRQAVAEYLARYRATHAKPTGPAFMPAKQAS